MLDRGGGVEEGRVDVFSKMRSDGKDKEGGGLNPPLDEGTVHPDVRGDFTVPVSCGLEFVETVLESIFVVGPAGIQFGLVQEISK